VGISPFLSVIAMWMIRFSGQENKISENVFKIVSLLQKGKIQVLQQSEKWLGSADFISNSQFPVSFG
jgi:hypothetical protein